MERHPLKSLKGQKGQTAIEYVLMLLVMVSLISSFMVYIKRNYLGDLTKCNQAANRRTLLCKINSLISPNLGGSKRLQYYPFKK